MSNDNWLPSASLDAYLHPTYNLPALSDIKPITLQAAENFQDGIRETIEALQGNLKPDEQLFVYYTNGVESIQVGHIFMSSSNVAVISGLDQEGNVTRVIAHFHALQFVAKIMKTDTEPKERTKIGFSRD